MLLLGWGKFTPKASSTLSVIMMHHAWWMVTAAVHILHTVVTLTLNANANPTIIPNHAWLLLLLCTRYQVPGMCLVCSIILFWSLCLVQCSQQCASIAHSSECRIKWTFCCLEPTQSDHNNNNNNNKKNKQTQSYEPTLSNMLLRTPEYVFMQPAVPLYQV